MKAYYVALAKVQADSGGVFDILETGGPQTTLNHDHAAEHARQSAAERDDVSSLSFAGGDSTGQAETPDSMIAQNDPAALEQIFESGAPQYAIDALTAGRTWTTTTLNYAFLDSAPAYAPISGFTSLSQSQRDGVERIVEMVEQFTSLTFRQTDVAQSHIALGNADFGAGAGGYAWYPGGNLQNSIDGDVFINSYYSSQLTAREGNFAFMTLMHEFGHALGLKHPHEGVSLPDDEDSRQFTVESYNSHDEMGRAEPQSFMIYDIAALQDIYGANLGWATGDDVYDYSAASSRIETIWDAGGNDSITAAHSVAGAVIDLNEGAFSSIGQHGRKLAAENIGIAYGTVIENAEGTAYADRLVGNGTDNRLSGLSGNDILVGGGGSDAFVFGVGTGADTVEDFEVGLDRLVLTGTGLSFGALSVTEDAGDTLITFGADSVLLRDVNASDLDAGDFLFA